MTGGLWVGVNGDIANVDPQPTSAHLMLTPPVAALTIGGLQITSGDHRQPNPVVTCFVAALTGRLVHLYGPTLISGPAFTQLPPATLHALVTHLTRIRIHQRALLAQLATAADVARQWRPGSTDRPPPWTERTTP